MIERYGQLRKFAAFAMMLATTGGAVAQGLAPGQLHTGMEQTWPPVPAPDYPQEPGPGWPPRVVEVTRPLPGRPFKQAFVDVDGFHIRYVDGGKGPVTIVDVPGSAGIELSTAKDILARDYRVIELNPPGRGPDEPMREPHDNREYAIAFLHALSKLGVKQFHLISTSAGCNIGMQMAQIAPDRALSFTGEGGECFTRESDRRGQTARAVAAQKAANRGAGTWDNDYDLWSGWPAYQWAPNKWWQTPAFQARLMERRYMKSGPTHNHRDEMMAGAKDMKMPITDMVGDRDEIMKTTVAEAWHHYAPQSKFVIVPGGTHDIQNSQPEQFVEVLKACAIERLVGGLMCPGD
ncbi:MAG: alpha/beta fold hydrolase [Janthinobacterium lividum]